MGQSRGYKDELSSSGECSSARSMKKVMDSLGMLVMDPSVARHSAVGDVEFTLKLKLKHPDPSERRAYLETLARQKVIHASHAPAIAAVLQDSHWAVRSAAAQALACCHDGALPCLPKLIKCLKDEEWPVRSAVAEALRELCLSTALSPEELAEVGVALTRHLGDDHEDVRRAASDALAALGAPAAAKHAASMLHSSKAETRRCVAEMLGRLAADSPDVAGHVAVLLAQCLEDLDTCVRNTAAGSLVQCGQSAASAVAPILRAARDMDVRLQAIEVLGALDANDPSIAQLLMNAFIGCLGDVDCDVRRAATTAFSLLPLLVIEPHAAKLAELLGDSEAEVACAAAHGLGRLGSASVLYTRQLIECTCTKDSSMREALVSTLERLGPGVGEHAVSCLRDERAEVRSAAAEVMRRLNRSGSCAATIYVTELSACLQDTDSRVLRAVIEMLTVIGFTALLPNVAKLESLLECSDEGVRIAAVEALGRFSSDCTYHELGLCAEHSGASVSLSQSGVSALVRRFSTDGSPEVRLAAAHALLEMGSDEITSHLSDFAARLTDTDMRVRRAVVIALGMSGLAFSPHVPAVVSRLEKDECPAVREAAAAALGSLGPEGAAYAEVLGKCACEDSSDSVRAAATDALHSVLALGSECGQSENGNNASDTGSDLDLGDDMLPM